MTIEVCNKNHVTCPFNGRECDPHCGLSIWYYDSGIPQRAICALAAIAAHPEGDTGVNVLMFEVRKDDELEV